MKFFKIFVPALIIAALPISNVVAINVTINAQPLKVTTSPVLENGTTLVPIRSILEAFGMTLNWDDSTKTATASDSETEIKLTLGSNTAYVDGVATNLSVPAKSIDGSIMVPIRFISEALGNTIDWNPEDQAVNVYSFDLSKLKPDEQKLFKILASCTNKFENISKQLENMNDGNMDCALSYLKSMSSCAATASMQLEVLKIEDPDLDKVRIKSISGLKGMASSFDKMAKALESGDDAMMKQGFSEFKNTLSK